MLIEFFKRLKKSKWLPWVGMSPFIIFPLVIMLDGEMGRGVGILAFFGSAFVGIALGGFCGKFLNKRVLMRSAEFGERLGAGLACFGFLFLPALIGSWTNTYLDTDIDMHTLGAHFLWACVGGWLFFVVKPSAE